MITSQGDNLIFLVSQPRSGSTLLQLILNTHPDVASTPEPWLSLHPLYALRGKGVVSEYDSKVAHDALKEFLHYGGMDEDFYRQQVSHMLTTLYNQALKTLGGQFFIDKTPRYYEIIEDLAHLWPEARFIILFRNPLAVLGSIVNTWLSDNWVELLFFKRDLLTCPHNLIKFIKNYDHRALTVRYDDLVIHPSATVKKICDFIGIYFKEEMLTYNVNNQWQMGDKKVMKYNYPQKESLNKWEKDLAKNPQLAYFTLSYLKELGQENIEIMGYDYEDLLSRINKIDIISSDINREFTWTQLMKSDEILAHMQGLDEYRFFINAYYRSSYQKEVTSLTQKYEALINAHNNEINSLNNEINSLNQKAEEHINEVINQKEKIIELYENTFCRKLTMYLEKQWKKIFSMVCY